MKQIFDQNNFTENQAEKERIKKRRVGFLFECHTAEELKRNLDLVASEGELDLVMLNEYDLQINEVNNNIDLISSSAKKHNADIILAAGVNGKRVPWTTIRPEIIQAGAQPLDVDVTDDEIWDSIGYFFGKNGETYAFPKNHKHPIHFIPNTKMAVTICGEINYITPDLLEQFDINLILNPSREADDPYLRFRMLGFFNPNITDDEIHNELRKNSYLNDCAEGIYRPSDYSHLDEHSRATLEEYDRSQPIPSAEELKQEYKEKFDKIKSIIKVKSNEPSMYAKKIKDILELKKITILRCDGRGTTGILNPSLNVKIDQLDYKHDYYQMTFSQKI